MINSYDGFRAERHDSTANDAYELYIVLYASGERIDQRKIMQFKRDIEGAARSWQAFYALAALCRFVNSSGSLKTLNTLARNFFLFVEDRVTDTPSGLTLIHCQQEVESPTFVLLDEATGKCTVVREQESTEEIDFTEFAELLDDATKSASET